MEQCCQRFGVKVKDAQTALRHAVRVAERKPSPSHDAAVQVARERLRKARGLAAEHARQHDEMTGGDAMSAETLLLRQAASLLRKRAEAAMTERRWSQDGIGEFGWYVHGADVETDDSHYGRDVANYIALVDPAVGAAFADWLDTAAENWEALGSYPAMPESPLGRLLITARALLREEDA